MLLWHLYTAFISQSGLLTSAPCPLHNSCPVLEVKGKIQRVQGVTRHTFQQGLLREGLLRDDGITHNFLSSAVKSLERINGLTKEQSLVLLTEPYPISSRNVYHPLNMFSRSLQVDCGKWDEKTNVNGFQTVGRAWHKTGCIMWVVFNCSYPVSFMVHVRAPCFKTVFQRHTTLCHRYCVSIPAHLMTCVTISAL